MHSRGSHFSIILCVYFVWSTHRPRPVANATISAVKKVDGIQKKHRKEMSNMTLVDSDHENLEEDFWPIKELGWEIKRAIENIGS